MSGTSILSATKPNPGSHREAASVGKEIWNSAICHREGIKRILDWHTDAEWTKAEWRSAPSVAAAYLRRISAYRPVRKTSSGLTGSRRCPQYGQETTRCDYRTRPKVFERRYWIGRGHD